MTNENNGDGGTKFGLFECDACGLRFTTNVDLARHIRDSGECDQQ